MKRAVVLLLAVVVAGCAAPTPPPAGPPSALPAPQKQTNLIPDGYQGRYRLQATVLANAQHGPQLCQTVAESLPPQCGGPDIADWKWEGLDSQEAAGTRWGVYVVTGKYDGKVFTLTEPAKENDGSFVPETNTPPNFKSPCAEPPGGWKPADVTKATDDALNATTALVTADPDFAGLWIDETLPAEMPTPMNNTLRLILNVRFVRDLDRHEAEIRKVWGGALCVSLGKHTQADLLKIQQELSGEPGLNYSSPDVLRGTVEIGVFAAHASRQRELDAKYGPGVVVLRGVLHPID
ncbi:hypothetical protein Rhe02_68300 [Rhizocola hellebori]|uniref:Uncharacterized protein n=1 Tax=Rhizocola hellebori TaxID=1392758 RepID=A0A8J3QDA0_9ACTN|nr:hypothetical protein [Rhizocola hellebori]GIH08763.1 hypothetical protein Rhe02_68300 [Rhizocola hellebori]